MTITFPDNIATDIIVLDNSHRYDHSIYILADVIIADNRDIKIADNTDITLPDNSHKY
jgi:hypothetical protein